ncbi:hypothetical protein [Methylibium sp.]|uniref:hypothetical protein n=1 Tax=Methylibium sp. TaxID=2067992 RepID=UPI003BA9E4C8
MKHLLLILIVAVVVYAAWNLASPIERRHGARLITRHALRLGAIVAVVLLLLAAAYYLPATGIL